MWTTHRAPPPVPATGTRPRGRSQTCHGHPGERAHSVSQARDRLAVTRTIVLGLDNAQAVSTALMASDDRASALVALQDLLGVDEKGTRVITELQWGRLTKDTRPYIQQEIDELEALLRKIDV